MHDVHDCIYVGDGLSCAWATDDWAIVHACKNPCHQRAVGYRGNLLNRHEHYLDYQTNGDLYLNMVDMDRPQRTGTWGRWLRRLSRSSTNPSVIGAC